MTPRASKKRGKVVLIVDDDANFRDLMRTKLASGNISVLEAKDGREALKMVRSVLPNLILLDLEMPEMNGIEVFGRLREMPELNQTRILFLTTHENPHDMDWVDVDFGDLVREAPYIRKSETLDTVLSKVRDALRD